MRPRGAVSRGRSWHLDKTSRVTRTIDLMREFHSVVATARVALKTSADLVSCRLRPMHTEVSLLMGRWEAQAVSTFCSSEG